MSTTRDIALKLVAVFCVAAVIAALVVAHQSPAAGYELSMYGSTPALFWYMLIPSLFAGVGIVIHELATGRFQQNRTYLAGFAVILLTLVAFLCLPDIRNYVTWRADQMGHIGFVQDMALTGHVGSFNPYPVVHTLLFQIASITGSPIFTVVNLNTALVFIVFVLTTYLLATVVLPHRGQQLLAALVAGGTMAGLVRFNLIPNTWSILMLPLVFYCYFKRDRLPFKVLLVIVLAAYPFFHPLSSLIIIAALTVIEIPKPIYWRLFRRLRLQVPEWVKSRPVVWPIVLEAAIFVPWVLTREAFRTNVLQFWHQLVTFSGSQEAQKTGADIEKTGLDTLGVIVLALKMYGEMLIFLTIAAVGIILLARQLRSGDHDHGKFRLLFVGTLLLLACLAYGAFFVGIPGAEALAANRLLVYIEVASIPFIAFALWELPRMVRFKLLAWSAIFGVILLTAFLNVRLHNASPYMFRPSEQVTQADMTGMTWYLEKKDPEIYAFWVMTTPDRFAQCTLATTATRSREDIRYHDVQFRDHFGTDNYTTVGEQFSINIYGNINKYDKLAYQTVWQALNRFNDRDFERLEQDPTVKRIYSNGATDILFITGHD